MFLHFKTVLLEVRLLFKVDDLALLNSTADTGDVRDILLKTFEKKREGDSVHCFFLAVC